MQLGMIGLVPYSGTSMRLARMLSGIKQPVSPKRVDNGPGGA
jgi:hypothetical protein